MNESFAKTVLIKLIQGHSWSKNRRNDRKWQIKTKWSSRASELNNNNFGNNYDTFLYNLIVEFFTSLEIIKTAFFIL